MDVYPLHLYHQIASNDQSVTFLRVYDPQQMLKQERDFCLAVQFD